jgi:tetratricopeptide (TPR) repeat protein
MVTVSSLPQILQQAYRHFAAGQFPLALQLYVAVLAQDGQQQLALLGCGYCHLSLGDGETAEGFFRRVLTLQPDFPPALAGLGECLIALGRPQEAYVAFTSLSQVEEPSALSFHGQGDALVQMGRMEDARLAFKEAIKRAPQDVHHHFALAQAGRFAPGDSRLAPLEALAKVDNRLDDPARCELHFALGKAYDELGRSADAFSHWQLANSIRRQDLDYDEAGQLEMIRVLAETFTADAIVARQGGGHPSQRPIFVVGMPRSGTTLVEQILASHPAIHGAGETMFLFRAIQNGQAGGDFPYDFSGLSATALQQLGAAYDARLAALAPRAQHVVDKLPANFLLLGLIHLALPQARIIHIQRDPVDTCLSCYSHLFTADIGYSYDLGELGRYYSAYQALMEHWRSVLPVGTMLELDYEALVADFDGEARRMIAYCGLEWDQACVSFHANPRAVHSLSATQVRQPLYATSVGRARAYDVWLGPLRLGMMKS